MLSFFFSKKNSIALVVALLSCCMFSAHSYATTEKTLYLRGGVGVAFSRDMQFTDDDCQSSSPPALFGCSSGNDGKSSWCYTFSNRIFRK